MWLKIQCFIKALSLQPDTYWHWYHDSLTHVESFYESLSDRQRNIKLRKPQDEKPIRLHLLQKINGRLPFSLRYWGFLYAKSGYYGADYNKAYRKHKSEVKALHKRECLECPWDGKTIFPGKEET